MVLHGRDLIVTTNGMAIAAAKSCELQVSCDDIEISSPTSGQWREFIADRKEWAVTTNHLVMFNHGHNGSITAVGTTTDGIMYRGASEVVVNGVKADNNGLFRGLNIFKFSKSDYSQVGSLENFDTFADIDGESARLVTYLEELTTDYIIAVVSLDAFGMSTDLQQALTDILGVPADITASFTTRGNYAFACIGDTATHKSSAQAMAGIGSTARTKLLLANGTPVPATPLRDAVARIGQTYTLQMRVDGLADDVLTGTAICKQYKVTGSLGNLAQGSFSWKGSGALN